MEQNPYYTPNQVAALLEDMRAEFRAVSEVVLELREDMKDVKNRLTSLEARVTVLEDTIRIGIPSINRRLSALEARVN